MGAFVPGSNATRRLSWLVLLLAGVAGLFLTLRRPIQNRVAAWLILRAEAPVPEEFDSLAEGSANPAAFLEKAWNTEKIPLRQLTLSYLKANVRTNPELGRKLNTLLGSAAIDPDTSVRELALSTLSLLKADSLFPLAAMQLRDCDPERRLLGLSFLSKMEAKPALPIVIGLLEDPDLRVVTTADSALRRWTGQDFGVRIAQAMSKLHRSGYQGTNDENIRTIRRGVEKWKGWWGDHQYDFPKDDPKPIGPGKPVVKLKARGFTVQDLQGTAVRLSDLRGKCALLNFWTTWCTACLIEIPDLVELQRQHPDLVVLGVSLDGISDEHGDSDRENAEKRNRDEWGAANAEASNPRGKVERVVKAKQINYPVIIDTRNILGTRFNGGELPTNVLIDKDGFVRRRFIGARSIPVLEAMIAEANGTLAATSDKPSVP